MLRKESFKYTQRQGVWLHTGRDKYNTQAQTQSNNLYGNQEPLENDAQLLSAKIKKIHFIIIVTNKYKYHQISRISHRSLKSKRCTN